MALNKNPENLRVGDCFIFSPQEVEWRGTTSTLVLRLDDGKATVVEFDNDERRFKVLSWPARDYVDWLDSHGRSAYVRSDPWETDPKS